MTTVSSTLTARCVHCLWNTDQDDPDALREVRDIHELIHPGGTVLVGVSPDTPPADPPPAAPPESPPVNGSVPRRHWTEERVVEAIQAWVREHGEPPTGAEWKRSGDGHPVTATVVNVFGSWNIAMVAAGFPPRTGRKRTKSVGEGTSAPAPPATGPGTDALGGTLHALAVAVEEASEAVVVAERDLEAARGRLRRALVELRRGIDSVGLGAS